MSASNKHKSPGRKAQNANLDYDFRLSQWCSKARECFTEDHRFIAWCKSDLGVTETAAQELTLRALAFDVVKDKAAWIQLRGFREIRSIEVLPTRRERVEVLEAAKVTGKPVRSIVREWKGARDLARFIAHHESRLEGLPPDIEAIVRKYQAYEEVAP